MSQRKQIDKAIQNILRWAERADWGEVHAEVFAMHCFPLCEALDMAPEELIDELEDYELMLVGWVFDDLSTRRLPPDGRNIVEDYLSRRGWNESAMGRRYLRALSESCMSIYEVVDVQPGRSCVVRDLVHGGKPRRVFEKLGTQQTYKWDHIAARVIRPYDKPMFSGAILPLIPEYTDQLLDALEGSKSEAEEWLAESIGAEAVAELSPRKRQKLSINMLSPLVTQHWLFGVMDRLHRPLPELQNTDGEALILTRTKFVVEPDDHPTIIARLDGFPEWEREGDDLKWLWFRTPSAQLGPEPEGEPAERTISGSVHLDTGFLILETNSVERTEAAKTVLAEHLGDLIGRPIGSMQTAGSMLEERGGMTKQPVGAESKIDPEVANASIHKHLETHYRKALDEPIPMLDNKTPRECAVDDERRGKVIAWLKGLENMEQRRARNEPYEAWDSSWMWRELGLEEFRDDDLSS